MAKRHLANAPLGNNANDGLTALTPWETVQYANDNAGDGNDVVMQTGTYLTDSTDTFFDVNLNGGAWEVEDGGSVTWAKGPTGSSSYVAREGSSVVEGAVTSYVGFTIDGTDANDAFEKGNVANSFTTNLTDMTLIGGQVNCFDHSARQGTTNLTRVTLDGSIDTDKGFGSSAFMGQTLPYSLSFIDCIVNINNASALGLGIQIINTSGTSNDTILFDGVTGTVSGAGASQCIALTRVSGFTARNIDLTVVGTGGSTQSAFFVSGDAANPFTGALLEDFVLRGDNDNEFILTMGNSQSDNGASTATVRNGEITGREPNITTGAPHNAVIGDGVTATVTNLTSTWGHVGLLLSLCDATVEDCTFRDQKGPSIYPKGCTAIGGVARNNVMYSSGEQTQTVNGFLSVAEQGSQDNDVFLFESNAGYVSDVTKINSLASNGTLTDTGNSGTWNLDTYYLASDDPSIDPVNDDFFAQESGISNFDIGEWNALGNTDIVDKTTYTKAQIDAIIAGGSVPPMVAPNTSFKIPANGIKTDITQTVGNPTTGDDDISIWFAANVPTDERQSNWGTVRALLRYVKAEWGSIPATGTAMIFHVDQGGTYENMEVNGTPTSDQIRLEVGDNVYTSKNSGHLITGVEYMLEEYLEQSTGN